jgi:hypothetical protein
VTRDEALKITEKYRTQLMGRIPPIDDFVPITDAFRAQGFLEGYEQGDRSGYERGVRDSATKTVGYTEPIAKEIRLSIFSLLDKPKDGKK